MNKNGVGDMCELDVDGDRLVDFRVIGYVFMLGNSFLSFFSVGLMKLIIFFINCKWLWGCFGVCEWGIVEVVKFK